METGTGLAQGHPVVEQLCPFSIPCTWMETKYCREDGDRWEDMLLRAPPGTESQNHSLIQADPTSVRSFQSLLLNPTPSEATR